MKSTLSLVTGAAMCALLISLGAGCSMGRTAAHTANARKFFAMMSEPGPTLTQSTGDHLHAINAVIDYDRRAMFGDLDLFFQTERPSRLSRWHDR
jgi:hypothetical protein